MKIKKSVCFLLLILLISVGIFCSCSPPDEKTITIYSSGGEVVSKFSQNYSLSDENMPYCQIALSEGVNILSEVLNCDKESALQKLWENEFVIYTYFDPSVQSSLNQVLQPYDASFPCGSAITDLNGNLVAVYSRATENDMVNYAFSKAPPCSTFKPLAVYGQAMERGLIHWTSAYHDSPYKQLQNSDGSSRNWPANADGKYRNEDVLLYEAIRKSLNTVAVKCLKDVGVNNSISFLEKNFGLSLEYEKTNSEQHGEEEVIGNIALGYLREGVSPLDMAGYYQVFATGGVYEKPCAVYKICDQDGKEIYCRESSPVQVFSPQTADVMNQLLQGVVKPGGTGAAAYCPGIDVSGKSGTGENNENYWFVGVTPEYSCAVWHGQNNKNSAPEIFSGIVQEIYKNNPDLKKEFSMHSSLQKVIYCEKSGLSISGKCTLIQVGYYPVDVEIQKCNIH